MEAIGSRDPGTLSNSWLLRGNSTSPALLVDAGAPPAALLSRIEEEGWRLAAILLTHRHHDHVEHLDLWTGRHRVPVVSLDREADHVPGVTLRARDGERIDLGGFAVEVLHVPGHTTGHAAFVVEGEIVFTGDTLFRGSVGGTTAPGHAGLEDLRRSVIEVLLARPDPVAIYPGHMEPTTVGRERETNPFVRAWTGRDPVRPRPCSVAGRPATLLLRAPDYDGGTKCWVRFGAGDEAIVPGSRVSG